MDKNWAPERIKQLQHRASRSHAERARSNAIFSSVGEGVISTDEKGIIERVNKAALDMLGFKKTDLIGKWFQDVIIASRLDGSLIENIDRPITKAFLAGKSISQTAYYKTATGDLLPVQINVSPIMLKNKPVGAIEIFRDFSLEQQVDQLKSDFISLASHQLRTPLTAINTYSHMLAEEYAGKLTTTQKSFISIILSATERMNNLINNLLNVTRVETGTIAVESRSMRLDTLVDEIYAEFLPAASIRRIKMEIINDLKKQTITSDRSLIKEVVSNLISNSIKYTKAKDTICIRLKERPFDIVISIKDNGYGIPEHSKKYIFSKFYRASNIIVKDVGGTGLGLYLAKIITDNLGGDIWFNSAENAGTTFYLAIPKKSVASKPGKFTLETS